MLPKYFSIKQLLPGPNWAYTQSGLGKRRSYDIYMYALGKILSGRVYMVKGFLWHADAELKLANDIKVIPNIRKSPLCHL